MGYWSVDGDVPDDVEDMSGQGNDGRCKNITVGIKSAVASIRF